MKSALYDRHDTTYDNRTEHIVLYKIIIAQLKFLFYSYEICYIKILKELMVKLEVTKLINFM